MSQRYKIKTLMTTDHKQTPGLEAPANQMVSILFFCPFSAEVCPWLPSVATPNHFWFVLPKLN